MDVDVRSPASAAETITEKDCVVVIDALRASATAISLLEAGAESVIPVAGDGADRFGENVLKAGEHHGERIDGFDFGNSPLEVRERAAAVEGETVVLRTTNGTRRVEEIAQAGTVMMGSLLNASALIGACQALPADSRVVFVPAGRRGDPAPEDTYTAVSLARRLQAALGDPVTANVPEGEQVGTNAAPPATPGQTTAPAAGGSTAVEHDSSPQEIFAESDTGRFLVSNGHTEDVQFCSQEDVFEAVPVLDDGRFVDIAREPSERTGRSDTANAENADPTERTRDELDTSHLDDVEDGCGCAEVWEHLSEQRG
jgi:2-phosphosulfolactate phosphatase